MRKRVWVGLLAAVLIAVTPLSAAYADNRSVDVGLNVDVARRYYSPDSLKRMVDVVARSGGDYVQLHVCDDQNYGVESHLLGQTVKTARKDKNGAWVNPATGGRFLSKRQISELVVYAAYRNVELIPEVDLPGHATAVKRLAGDWGGRLSWTAGNELVTDRQGARFTVKLDSEVWEMFGRPGGIGLGMDEFSQSDRVDYYNRLVSYWADRRVAPRVYSDFFRPRDVGRLDNRVTVLYWCQGDWGGGSNSGVVSASELVRRGFRVVNANGYYLYFVPSARSLTREALSYSMWDMDSHWDLGRTDLTREARTDGVSGAMLSVWGEDSAGFSDGVIVGAVRGWFARFVVDARR
ncbi:Chb protein [Parascardovia denticolens IPLA 20019]|uniref:family 20 glycosylhydrolase n=1 Tax=Parascardovia denticolens TaxID=78258 RepID=UPI0002669E40|nr:family 20 glycosylhydrolase [Parascardovia denticolens]EIT87557.1 Chb protein [Parascardovia denticolens IPLA 20019]